MKTAALPSLTRTEQRAAARASRERNDGRALFTIGRAADHIGKSTRTVYRMIHAGELRTIRVGRSLRIRPSDLDDYLDRRVVS